MNTILGFQLSNGAYDKLKKGVTLLLPALGAAYFGLSQIWGLPHGEEVVGTLAIIATFGGTVMELSTQSFHKEYELIQEPITGH